MQNLPLSKIALACAAVFVVACIGLYTSGAFTNKAALTDGGIDVRNTKCEGISAARLAVAAELEKRKGDAQAAFDAEKEKTADDYFVCTKPSA